MATQITDIVNGIEGRIAAVQPTWAELPYKIEVQKNNLSNHTDRYGARALDSEQLDGVTKQLTFTQSFEVVLTQGYNQSSINDIEQVNAGLSLRAVMLDLYLDFINTKVGLPGTVLNITDLSQGEMEYLEQDKVAILRSTMNITYRLSLI